MIGFIKKIKKKISKVKFCKYL